MSKENKISRKLFKILDEFKISDIQKLSQTVNKFEEADLQNLHTELTNHYNKYFDEIIKDIQSNKNGLNVYLSGSIQLDVNRFINQFCLYSDRIIVHDNLLSLTKLANTPGFTIEGIRQQFLYQLPNFLKLRPLAENGSLVLIPHKRCIESSKELIDLLSKRDYNDIEFRTFCYNKMKMRVSDDFYTNDPKRYELKMGENPTFALSGCRLTSAEPTTILSFNGKYPEKMIEINLSEAERYERTKTAIENMIQQSANHLNSDLFMTSILNAKLITNSDVEYDQLNWKLSNTQNDLMQVGIDSKIIQSILSMDLNYVDNVPLEKIMKIALENKEAFEDFRLAFREYYDAIKNISIIPGSKRFNETLRNIKDEKINPELRKLNREFKRIKTHRLLRSAGGTVVTVASVTASFFTAGTSLALIPPFIGTGGGIGITMKEYADYIKEKDALKENNMYFLWKLKKQI